MDDENFRSESVPEPATVVAPEFTATFPVKLFGLPLDWHGNFACVLVFVLTAALQIRFSNTFMAEGGFAFFGFIGYVALRILLVKRRYAYPGLLEVDDRRILVPASLNHGRAEIIELSDLTRIDMFVYRGRHSTIPTSIILFRGGFFVRIPWLALDLQEFATALERRGCKIRRQMWNPATTIVVLILGVVLAISLLLLLLNRP